jgi:hypothetical protein
VKGYATGRCCLFKEIGLPVLMYQTNVKNHLSVIVNMVTNGNMVIGWVRKSQINTLTPLNKLNTKF